MTSASQCAKFFPFCTSKTHFFYFTHLFWQNTYISLSILHIYSIKYTFFYIIFIIFSLMDSLSLRPNHRHHHPATIKSKPRSVYLLCAFFVLILMVDQSRNPDPFNSKPKVDWSEGCEGWLDPFLCCGCKGWLDSKPKCMKKEELTNEWLKQRVNEEWERERRKKKQRQEKEKKMRKTETNKRQEREKINIIINGQGIVTMHKV